MFCSRWKEEYLQLLQQRSKWCTPNPGLVVDDLVLVKDENLPPMKWPLARVIELLFDGDGVARVAVLKLFNENYIIDREVGCWSGPFRTLLQSSQILLMQFLPESLKHSLDALPIS